MENRNLAKVGVLGILNEKESVSKEKIVEHLQHNFSKYWGFSSGVLSPVIDELKEEEYISALNHQDISAYSYHITPSGKKYLCKLIRDPFDDHISDFSNRNQALIRLGFLHHLPGEEQAIILNNFEKQLKEERSRWEDILNSHEQEYMDLVQAGYRRDLIELNINMLNALLKWVEHLDIRSTG